MFCRYFTDGGGAALGVGDNKDNRKGRGRPVFHHGSLCIELYRRRKSTRGVASIFNLLQSSGAPHWRVLIRQRFNHKTRQSCAFQGLDPLESGFVRFDGVR